jgi:hypothetical protein
MQQRKQALSVLLAKPLRVSHCFQLGPRGARILTLFIQSSHQSLLFGELSLAFNGIELHLPQFIQKCVSVHVDLKQHDESYKVNRAR